MAIVAEGSRSRVYLSPNDKHVSVAESADPGDAASAIHVPIANDPRALWCQLYGLTHFDHLFTPRQLVALTTFSDLVREARDLIRRDALAAGLPDDDTPLEQGGLGAKAYAEAVSTYLAFVLDRTIDRHSTIATWDSSPSKLQLRGTFARQALPMTWDYGDGNVFCESSGAFLPSISWVAKAVAIVPARTPSASRQQAAQDHTGLSVRFVSTDPPYYDNIGYADLSDFFYPWLRRALRDSFPSLFSTIAVPKSDELIATPYRHGSKDEAERFFHEGMTRAMGRLTTSSHPAAPVTIYYAFKQSETADDLTTSTGWVTFLEAVSAAGLSLCGTWPMRTELGNRMIGAGTNALASSIVLVCRPRAKNAGTISRKQFIRQLNATLPDALAKMTGAEMTDHSPVAPVDLSQAIIGPGMAIFSKYDAVLEADGTPMTVKTALQLINRFLAEDDFDADTQFCLHWFEQCGWDAGQFGEANTLAQAKGTSVDGVKAAGVVESGGGRVRLLKWKEYEPSWDPASDSRLPVWEALHQLIRAYGTSGDAGAARVLTACARQAEAARQLAYRLYTLCERKGWAEDARAYNEVVTGWSSIEKAALASGEAQKELFA